MEIIRIVEGWFYPGMLLVLFIFCLTKLNNKNAIFFIIGFGIEFFNSLIWRLIPAIMKYESLNVFYDIYTHVSFVLFIISMVFIILGIYNLHDSKSDTFDNFSKVSAKKFGNIGLYSGLLSFGAVLLITGSIGLLGNRYSYNDTLIIVFAAIAIVGFILVISMQIYFLVMLYRVWQYAINESKRLDLFPSIESPGQAIGYLFIPFYNFYWIFQAYGKISKDLNAIASVKNVPAQLSGALGTVISILTLLGIIPFVGYFTAFLALILLPVFIYQTTSFCAKLSQIE